MSCGTNGWQVGADGVLFKEKFTLDELDYGFDWVDWLVGDTILSVAWTIPPGLTIIGQSFTSTIAVIWLGGGEAEASYSCVCVITTAGGRVKAEPFKVRVVSPS